MEPKHGGLVQMIFLLQLRREIFRFQPLVFGDVPFLSWVRSVFPTFFLVPNWTTQMCVEGAAKHEKKKRISPCCGFSFPQNLQANPRKNPKSEQFFLKKILPKKNLTKLDPEAYFLGVKKIYPFPFSKKSPCWSSWWFQPIWKIWTSNWIIFPK